MPRTLCRFDELSEGEARGFGPFEGARQKVIVVRKGRNLYAYLDACPHYGDTPMAWRTDAYLNACGSHIICASHGSEFEIDSGRCIRGAALGKSLTPVPVEVNVNGEIVIKT
jgi:nitrite reductase/ring-hydroxylating ferredoxin subunit